MSRAIALAAAAALTLAAAAATAQETLPEGAVAQARFTCADDKTIDATFYSDKVDLVLSDDRTESLPQVMSGSGARYANADESFVFWNKGDTAFITEGTDPNAPPTFADCVDEADKS